MGQIITASDVTIAYDKNRVIRSASFVIQEQDFVCVVGANGSGKSTLIKTILGLIKPEAGKITFGSDVTRRQIGFMPQDTKINFNFPATVLEIVLSGTLGKFGSRFFYRKEDKSCAMRALTQLKIANLKDASFCDLSGGQKQKVLLARALAATSKILILDEPSNNLDHKSRKAFYESLKALNASGLTIIIITHDLDAEDLIGNKIISIVDGVVSCESTADFLKRYK